MTCPPEHEGTPELLDRIREYLTDGSPQPEENATQDGKSIAVVPVAVLMP